MQGLTDVIDRLSFGPVADELGMIGLAVEGCKKIKLITVTNRKLDAQIPETFEYQTIC